jgi:UPF0755 protein
VKRILIIVLSSVVVAGLLLIYLILWAPNYFDGDRFVIVSKGENFSQVMDSLQKVEVVHTRWLFSAAGRMLGLTTRMQIGKYRFKSSMSNKDLLEDLRYGKTIESITVTLPEGMRASRDARILSHQLGIDSSRFMMFLHDTAFIGKLGVRAPSLEGYLFPRTYKLYWQQDESDIIKQLVLEFWTFFNDSLRGVVMSKGLSINEVLTVASIVEGETAVDSERSVIAGIYYNRLRKRMRLEADPTVEYILGESQRRLHHSDLFRESPYNTYRHPGLPPGPINNPGKAAILAALFPKKHNYLFFVANGEGGHTFSVTYKQHLHATKKYRKTREEQQKEENGNG